MVKPVAGRAVARVLVAASLSLGGCANLVEFTGKTQDTGILTPNTVQGEHPQTFLEKATGINDDRNPGARGARQLRGGTGIPKQSIQSGQRDLKCGDGKEATPGARGSDPDRYTFFCRQEQAELDSKNPEKAKTYLAAGLTLSNEVCDGWFNHLLVTQVSLRQSSDMISTVGSLTAAILGFTQTPPEVTGLTASVFGTTKSAVDNLSANYIVATDLTTVAAAVREYRGLYAREIDASPTTWNYYTARRVIMAYDNTCSALFVRKFVNARVSGAKGDNETNPLLEAAIVAFASDGAKYFGKEITPAQMVDIYALAILRDTPQPVRDALLESLRKETLINANNEIAYKTGITTNDLANAIVRANIDTELKRRATARVSLLQQQFAEAAKKKTADEAVKVAAKGKAQDLVDKAKKALKEKEDVNTARQAKVEPARKEVNDAFTVLTNVIGAHTEATTKQTAAQAEVDKFAVADTGEDAAKARTALTAAKGDVAKAKAELDLAETRYGDATKTRAEVVKAADDSASDVLLANRDFENAKIDFDTADKEAMKATSAASDATTKAGPSGVTGLSDITPLST